MGTRDKSELDADLDVRLQAEALEAMVELDKVFVFLQMRSRRAKLPETIQPINR